MFGVITVFCLTTPFIFIVAVVVMVLVSVLVVLVLRGTIVNRAYGIHKNLYI